MPATDNTNTTELIVQVTVVFLSFLLGRYSTYRSDCRVGMKELNTQFYQPFISLYENARHARAMWFVDLSIEVQRDMMKLLLEYRACCAPKLQRKILELDQPFSSYSEEAKEGVYLSERMSIEDVEYIEKLFGEIYTLIDQQYKRNTRKLYCSWLTRVRYGIADLLCWFEYKDISINVGEIMKKRIPCVVFTCALLSVVYLLLDVFNVPSRMGIDIPSLNWDGAALVIGNIIVIGLFLVTYFLLDKRSVEKENNQREVAELVLKLTYDRCEETIKLFDNQKTTELAAKKCNRDALEFQDSVLQAYLNLPFEHTDMINDFVKSGVIAADEYDNYLTVCKLYQSHIRVKLIFDDRQEFQQYKREDLDKAIADGRKLAEQRRKQ